MNKKSVGLILILLGVVLLIGGAISGVTGFLATLKNMEPMATFEAPDELQLEITEPDTYTLWHDHQTWHNGSKVSNPPALPNGIGFSIASDSGQLPAFTPFSSSQTLSSGSRQAVGVGSFEAKATGTYTITPQDFGTERRVLSVSQGNFVAQLAGSMGRGFLFMFLAFNGLVLSVVGIIMMILGRKKTSPTV
jgi:hypothetical protein